MVWDYHVILLQKTNESYLIYDFDTRSDFPVSAIEYLDASFPANLNINENYQASFRLVTTDNYLKNFYSDRSHMYGIISKEQYPDYPALTPKENSAISLQHFIDTNTKLHPDDKLLNLSEFRNLISQK